MKAKLFEDLEGHRVVGAEGVSPSHHVFAEDAAEVFDVLVVFDVLLFVAKLFEMGMVRRVASHFHPAVNVAVSREEEMAAVDLDAIFVDALLFGARLQRVEVERPAHPMLPEDLRELFVLNDAVVKREGDGAFFEVGEEKGEVHICPLSGRIRIRPSQRRRSRSSYRRGGHPR